MHTFLRCHLKTKEGLRFYVGILDIHRKKIFREIVKTNVYIVPAIFGNFGNTSLSHLRHSPRILGFYLAEPHMALFDKTWQAASFYRGGASENNSHEFFFTRVTAVARPPQCHVRSILGLRTRLRYCFLDLGVSCICFLEFRVKSPNSDLRDFLV